MRHPNSYLCVLLLGTFLVQFFGVSADLVILANNLSLTSFDIDWRTREQRSFDHIGVLHNRINFTTSCVAVPTQSLNTTDILHIDYEQFHYTACSTVSSLVNALSTLYHQDGNKFAGLLLTGVWDADLDLVTIGSPLAFENAPYDIGIAPEATKDSLYNYTNNYTTLPTVQFTDAPGPLNDFFKGKAAVGYRATLLVVYIALLAYATYLHVEAYKKTGGFKNSFNIKSWVFLFSQFFMVFQILFHWLPSYPYALGNFFFWYSYVFGFIAYTLVLLTWVKIVSHDRSAQSALPEKIANAMHICSYVVIVIMFLLLTFIMLGGSLPDILILYRLRVFSMYLMPIILILQAVVFAVYGIKLMTLLKTFKMTEEKRNLLKRMNILTAATVTCFIITALMTFLSTLNAAYNSNSSLALGWTIRVLRDVCIFTLVGVIYGTLNAGKSARLTSQQSGSNSDVSGGASSKLRVKQSVNGSIFDVSSNANRRDFDLEKSTSTSTTFDIPKGAVASLGNVETPVELQNVVYVNPALEVGKPITPPKSRTSTLPQDAEAAANNS